MFGPFAEIVKHLVLSVVMDFQFGIYLGVNIFFPSYKIIKKLTLGVRSQNQKLYKRCRLLTYNIACLKKRAIVALMSILIYVCLVF